MMDQIGKPELALTHFASPIEMPTPDTRQNFPVRNARNSLNGLRSDTGTTHASMLSGLLDHQTQREIDAERNQNQEDFIRKTNETYASILRKGFDQRIENQAAHDESNLYPLIKPVYASSENATHLAYCLNAKYCGLQLSRTAKNELACRVAVIANSIVAQLVKYDLSKMAEIFFNTEADILRFNTWVKIWEIIGYEKGLPDKYHRNSIEAVVALSASWSDTDWETDCCQVLLRAAQETGINLNTLFSLLLKGFHAPTMSLVRRLILTPKTFFHRFLDKGKECFATLTHFSQMASAPTIAAISADIISTARNIFSLRLTLLQPSSLPPQSWFSSDEKWGCPDRAIRDLHKRVSHALDQKTTRGTKWSTNRANHVQQSIKLLRNGSSATLANRVDTKDAKIHAIYKPLWDATMFAGVNFCTLEARLDVEAALKSCRLEKIVTIMDKAVCVFDYSTVQAAARNVDKNSFPELNYKDFIRISDRAEFPERIHLEILFEKHREEHVDLAQDLKNRRDFLANTQVRVVRAYMSGITERIEKRLNPFFLQKFALRVLDNPSTPELGKCKAEFQSMKGSTSFTNKVLQDLIKFVEGSVSRPDYRVTPVIAKTFLLQSLDEVLDSSCYPKVTLGQIATVFPPLFVELCDVCFPDIERQKARSGPINLIPMNNVTTAGEITFLSEPYNHMTARANLKMMATISGMRPASLLNAAYIGNEVVPTDHPRMLADEPMQSDKGSSDEEMETAPDRRDHKSTLRHIEEMNLF